MALHPVLEKIKASGRKPKVVLLGSGGLSIGQAGEFDYSGSQAARAIRDEGCEVIIVNPNIATVQTDPAPQTRVYLYPVEPEWVERVIVAEKADAIIGGFGGQTALNCLIKLEESGALERHGVTSLGTAIESLRITEDRKRFADAMLEIGMPIPSGEAASTIDAAKASARRIGYPVIVRAAYALGGLGSGFASDDASLEAIVGKALAAAPQVLIEKSLKGWKELEYEIMRDSRGNSIAICNMENIDPLGIHTGDSVVVAPSQTLSDSEFQRLRSAALKIAGHMGIVGECNVQFALDPHSREFFIIEVNARLSRSSALASKATGYPIAAIAAKVVLGHGLLDLKNPVTGYTSAFYEPALDYVTVKVPRWDMSKFEGVARHVGSAMKSVGEAMAIGRGFEEAYQKAFRMVIERSEGVSLRRFKRDPAVLREELENATDQRIFALMEAFRLGWTIEEVNRLSGIDLWFLARIRGIAQADLEIVERSKRPDWVAQATREDWTRWKRLGFSDEQIATLALDGCVYDAQGAAPVEVERVAAAIRSARLSHGVRPVAKRIDTTSAEYPSPSNYYFLTYCGDVADKAPEPVSDAPTAIVLGGGPYRIGSSVEFDWCAVSASTELRARGWRSIVINCNPETVSTDYNVSTRLYFDEISLERVLDVAEIERPRGVIVCMGGQKPMTIAGAIQRSGIAILGHSAESVDQAEDRARFSALLRESGIDQPAWVEAVDRKSIDAFVAAEGFPLLIRPSYVLSGAGMRVVHDRAELERYMTNARRVSRSHPVVLSRFLGGANEVELDGVARGGELLADVVSEHVENAGVHSGDATLVVPAQRIPATAVARIREVGALIARKLKLHGPFNIQFLVKNGAVSVIECNARASRSLPFVSKVTGTHLAKLATRVLIGEALDPGAAIGSIAPSGRVGVKASMFSFARLPGADPILGVEMQSTGEVGCIGRDMHEALLLSFQATGIRAPKKGILLALGATDSLAGIPAGVPVHRVSDAPTASRMIRAGEVDLVVSFEGGVTEDEARARSAVRRVASQLGCHVLTDRNKAEAFFAALAAAKPSTVAPIH